VGEAKRRKSNDPFYGKVPKRGRGIVISCPVEIIRPETINLKSSDLDPHELRRNLLFWDRLVWPDNRYISIGGSSAEVDFLTSCGILSRPIIDGPGGSGGDILVDRQVRAFEQLEQSEPGLWSLSEGESSILIHHRKFTADKGLKVELFRAVPVPERGVPLEEVLEFKRRRISEIRELILCIDSLYSQVVNSKDSATDFRRAVEEIDLRCADAIRVAREERFPFRLASLNFGYSLNVGSIASIPLFSSAGGELLRPYGLEAVGQLVGATVPLLGISGDIGRRTNGRPSPFRVAGQLHEEL
jgi:hypothetical protein